jgi:putative hemolysin
LDINKVNDIQSRYPDLKGPSFSEKVLEEVGVKYELPQEDLKNIPAEGGFITVSNHHFGSIDGLILNAVVGSRRPDYKLLTTFLLALIPSLKEAFLPVDNLSGGKADAKSVNGIRMALRHIADGGSIGFFPAGEVATWQHRKKRREGGFFTIQDKPWADNITKLIKRSGLPVVPIYFEGTNSKTFHRLGLIHPRLRTVRLIHELFNKQGTTVKVRIGRPILPEELEGREITELSWYLRGRCYALKNAE